MKQIIDKENILTHSLSKWKDDQKIKTIAFKKFYDLLEDGEELLIQRKLDGELANCRVKGSDAKFGAGRGRIRSELPVLNEIRKILKSKEISNAELIGELVGLNDKGNILPFDLSQAIIKKPLTPQDDDRIAFCPFDFYTINSKYQTEEYEDYKKSFTNIQQWFKSSKLILPVDTVVGNKTLLKKMWEKWVIQEESEGLVVRRSSNNVIYKMKPYFSWDVVILAVGTKHSKAWKKNIASAVLVAFMDSDKVFRFAGKVGGGFSHEERVELFDWAKKSYVSEDDNFLWVKPSRIMEVKWERHEVDFQSAWTFNSNKFTQVEDRLSATGFRPKFMRYRDDKDVRPSDLRLNQIPDWEASLRHFKKASILASQVFY